ncbi:hypothetical protein Tco_0448469 [Tanacetum coccineum]
MPECHDDPSTPLKSVASILEGFINDPPFEENENLFDWECKTNDAPIDEAECFDPGGDNDEIDAFLAIEVPTYIEGYYDSEGDVTYLESLLSDDTTHNLYPEVFFDHEPQQLRNEPENEPLITFSPKSVLPPMSSPVNIIIIPIQECLRALGLHIECRVIAVIKIDLTSEEDIIDNLLNDDSTHERLTFNIELDAPVINNVDELNEDECFDPGGSEINVKIDNSFTFVTWIFLPYLTYPEVQILQKYQENGQNRTITDTGTELSVQKPKNAIKGLDRAGQALGILPALEVAPPVETAPDTEITSATLKSRTMVSTPPKGLGPSTEDPLETDVDPGARGDGEKTNLHHPADLKAAPVTRAIGSQEIKGARR